jgi:hypothetical protein
MRTGSDFDAYYADAAPWRVRAPGTWSYGEAWRGL